MTGTNIQGTNVISMIVPTNHADTYATHDSIYGKGGWREVETIAERDAIPQERRRRGMVVFVRETLKSYQLKNSVYNGGWVPFPATEDVTEIINQAIAEGKIIIDLTDYATRAEVYEEFAKYYTSGEVDALVELTANDLKEWVEDKHYLTQHQSLAAYVTKTELEGTLENYVLGTDLEQALTEYVKGSELTEALEPYAKTVDVESLLANYVTSEALTETLTPYAKYENIANVYATKNALEEAITATSSAIQGLSDRVSNIENDYVTEETLESKGYINSDNAREIISGYGYIDETALEQTLGDYVTVSDLQGYATELWVKDYLVAGKYTTVSDLQGYATERWVEDTIDEIISGEIDLTSYQKKNDDNLQTTSKNIVGAINEINAKPQINAYTKAETDALLVEKADKANVYTKAEEDALLLNKADKTDVYTKAEEDALLLNKADKAITYTKAEIDDIISHIPVSDSVYTKAETDALLAEKASTSEVLSIVEQSDIFVPTEDYEAKCAEYEAEIAALQEENTTLKSTVTEMQTKLNYVYDIVTTPHYDVLPDEQP